jgi:hypothetical protein
MPANQTHNKQWKCPHVMIISRNCWLKYLRFVPEETTAPEKPAAWGNERNWWLGGPTQFQWLNSTKNCVIKVFGLFMLLSCLVAPHTPWHQSPRSVLVNSCLLPQFCIYCLSNMDSTQHVFCFIRRHVQKIKWWLTHGIAIVFGRTIKFCRLLKPWKLAILL